SKQVRLGASPESGTIKTGGAPEAFEESVNRQTPAWQFRTIDESHPDWGWKNLLPTDWRNVLGHLRAFEGMTWNDIQGAAGGRSAGTNHHSLAITELVSRAQKRLTELGHDDVDEVFSLRLNNTVRIYGIKEERTLRIVWRDAHHGTKRGCCPTKSTK